MTSWSKGEGSTTVPQLSPLDLSLKEWLGRGSTSRDKEDGSRQVVRHHCANLEEP